jgi:hypothetical protein
VWKFESTVPRLPHTIQSQDLDLVIRNSVVLLEAVSGNSKYTLRSTSIAKKVISTLTCKLKTGDIPPSSELSRLAHGITPDFGHCLPEFHPVG